MYDSKRRLPRLKRQQKRIGYSMDAWNLPTSVNVAEVDWDIRTDFRIVIDVLIAFDNPEYDNAEKWLYAMMSMVVDFDNLPEELYTQMSEALNAFIDMGIKEEKHRTNRKVMDWEQDASLIVTAVNKVVGHEIRAEKYMHWWTFLASYLEIDNKCLYSHILQIRSKKARGKKLEKWEQQFYIENKSLIDIKRKLSAEEEEERKQLEEIFG